MEPQLTEIEQMQIGHVSETLGKRWQECVTQFPEELHGAVAGYVYEQLWYGGERFTELPTLDDFSHLDCGEWDTFKDFACSQLQMLGIDSDTLDSIARYFDLDWYAQDLADDYYIADTGRGTVHVYAVEW